EPGCGTCRTGGDTNCGFKKWSPIPGQTPWYNEFGVSTCPDTAPSCASCDHKDEARLRGLRGSSYAKECDCSTVKIGIDPCSKIPMTCECYCEQMNYLSKVCPHQIDQSKAP